MKTKAANLLKTQARRPQVSAASNDSLRCIPSGTSLVRAFRALGGTVLPSGNVYSYSFQTSQPVNPPINIRFYTYSVDRPIRLD